MKARLSFEGRRRLCELIRAARAAQREYMHASRSGGDQEYRAACEADDAAADALYDALLEPLDVDPIAPAVTER